MFYQYITTKRNDTPILMAKMEETVDELMNRQTDVEHPGMLLGLIQSGKTRAFIGVIARGFDLRYNVCIVITKSSTALVQQTVKRIKSEFDTPVKSDYLYVYDIMKIPPLTQYILDKKIIIVAKKEDDNLRRLSDLLFNQYPELGKKNVLIIDDEADFASLSYQPDSSKPDGKKFGVLAEQISDIRTKLNDNSDFLQVTATPYSLYLQPKNITVNNLGYSPLRPSFTVVIPEHSRYIGGRVYFELSQDVNSYAHHIFCAVNAKEFSKLTVSKAARKPDSRLKQNILETPILEGFRNAFINYIVAGSIRSLQFSLQDNAPIWSAEYKSAYLIHVHTGQKSHFWEYELIIFLIDELKKMIDANKLKFSELIENSYREFKISIEKAQLQTPDLNQVIERAIKAITHGEISVKQVNSENSVIDLLNDDGQLRLDNPFNVFIGGQVLDRGITIDQLIAFYYGRNPNNFQMDTVLQHSRMYGARSLEDMSVTRLYTSVRIYNAMKEMHFFDVALRSCAERGEKVRFINRSKNGEIKPCSPNKISISSLITLKPHKRFLPYGFQTKSKSHISKTISRIDEWVINTGGAKSEDGFQAKLTEVVDIIKLIHSTFTYSQKYGNEDLNWDIDSFLDTLIYAAQGSPEIIVCQRKNRNISRMKNNNTAWTDAPDDGNKDLIPAKKMAEDLPVLLLIKQNGSKSQGWLDTPFYWPVFITPLNMQTSIYSLDE
jgi:hypothetical protein